MEEITKVALIQQQHQKGTTDAKGNENKDAEEPAKPTEITIMLPLNVAETPPDTIKIELEKLTNTKLTYQFSRQIRMRKN